MVMEERAAEDQIQHVIATLVEKCFDVHRSTGALKTVLGAVGDLRIDGDEVIVMAGPCSAETAEQVEAAAAAVSKAGAKIFRGGAFKPRSSPTVFRVSVKRG